MLHYQLNSQKRRLPINRPKINDEITADPVALVDENGHFLGNVSRDQAIYLAWDKGLDAIEVSPLTQPPVVKLANLGKYLYEQQKKHQKSKAHQKSHELKEIRLSITIDEHDYLTKVKKAQEFLAKGHNVKVLVLLKGRAVMFLSQGQEMIYRFKDSVNGDWQQSPKSLGRQVFAIIAPKSGS